MNKKTIRLFSVILAVCLVVFNASGFFADMIYHSDGFSFTDLGNGEISLCGWDNRSPELIVPESILGKTTAGISDVAFRNNTVITSVDFSSAYFLRNIGTMAFQGCISLSGDIYVPSSLEKIGTGAFQECPSIENVYFYPRISVSSQCFYHCSSLKRVVLDDDVISIGSYAFAECPQLVWIRIPDTVTSIADSAFNGSPNSVIYCYTDSYAHTYAEEKGISYVLIDAPAPTEPSTEPETEPATEPATEPETQEPTLAPDEYMLGDADNSGDIDVIDATFVQRYSIEAFIPCEDTIMQADVDSSGDVSSIDATFILRHLIHISVGYPIGEYVS